jgi:hypothetical protein
MTRFTPCSGSALLSRAIREQCTWDEWQPMETAPKNGDEILCQIEDTTAICFWDAECDEGAWINSHSGRATGPDNWRPL